MTIPELINNLGQPEWVAAHLFVAIEALHEHVGLTPRMKRAAAFFGALGAPILGYVLKVTTHIEAFDINAFIVTAGGAWVLSTQVFHRIWEALESRAVNKAVQITTVLPDFSALTPPINPTDPTHIIKTPPVKGGGGGAS